MKSTDTPFEIPAGITSSNEMTALHALLIGGRILSQIEDPAQRALWMRLARTLGIKAVEPLKTIVAAMVQRDDMESRAAQKGGVEVDGPRRQVLEDAICWMAGRSRIRSENTVIITALGAGGIEGIAAEYREKVDRARAGKPSFGTLHEEFRAALADTSRIGYPLEVLDKEIRARADASCRALIPVMHRAHRMVFDDDFTDLCENLSRQQPRELARLLDVALPPFNTMFVEWRQISRFHAVMARNYRSETEIPDRVGILFWPFFHDKPDAGVYHCIIVSGYPDQCGPAPMGMLFSMNGLVTEWGPTGAHPMIDPAGIDLMMGEGRADLKYVEETPIGTEYMDGVREKFPEQEQLAAYIGRHATLCLSPPFGPLHRETMENAHARGDKAAFDRQQRFLGLAAKEMSGLFRFLVAAFGLYQTGGSEFIMQESKKTTSRLIRSRPLPAYEYRVLKLRRPTTPKIVKKTLPSFSSLGRRFHTVAQSWHHRRLATAECARHPKVCPIATWVKVFDDETGEPVGSDRQECQICHRQRWVVPEHDRGNKDLGVVDKGYEITSSLPTGHRTEQVVEEFPKGVRLKSLPRFDAVAESKAAHEEARGK